LRQPGAVADFMSGINASSALTRAATRAWRSGDIFARNS
jgi:hypothetical protein